MHYLQWAKLHDRVRYELTLSGLPPLEAADLGSESLPVSVNAGTGYGDSDSASAIARLYYADPANVVQVPGTSSANFIALAIAAKHGDCVMLEHPRYDPLERAADFLGLRVIDLPRRADDRFDVRTDDVQAGLKSGARAVLLTNLHNPSGQYLSQEVIREMAGLCGEHSATLIVDEVYLDAVHVVTGQRRWTSAMLGDHVIATGSLTKIYGLGGLRAGWLIASGPLVERANEVMDVLSVENAGPSMAIARHVLSHLERIEEKYRKLQSQGQALFRPWLTDESRLLGYGNAGAIFEWVKLPEGITATRFGEVLASEYETRVVPGSFFGVDDHVRIGTGLPESELSEGLSRITDCLSKMVRR